MIQIIPCKDRFEELVHFVTRLNSEETHHIGYFGVGETDVRASLAECNIPPTNGFQLAYENEKLIGVFGVDANIEIGRAWLWGPIIEHEDWQNIADQLYTAIQPVIPNGIREQELFCDVHNAHLQEFAARYRFPLRSETAIFYLLRNVYIPGQGDAKPKDVEIADFQDGFFKQFENLHNELFPNTYFTAKQIVEKLESQRRLLTALKGGRLIGYHFCKTESELGYIDFIGTDPSARGMGVGAALLGAGVDWMFSNPAVHKINLNVLADNAPARALYKKFGFDIERVMRGYRKPVV